MKLERAGQLELVQSFLGDGKTVRKVACGESMVPTIPDGAVLQIEPLVPDQVRRGDVVLFAAVQGTLLIHRVARLFTRQGQVFLQAWGDNNPTPDSPVPSEQLIGRVVAFKTGDNWQFLEKGWRCYLKYFAVRYCWYYLNRLSRKVVRALLPAFVLKSLMHKSE